MKFKYVLGLISISLLVVIIGRPDPEDVDISEIYVIDGDTIDVSGKRYRLTGFDTPETKEPRCDFEMELGTKATFRVRELIAKRRPVELVIAKGHDKFGRGLAKLYVGSENVGDILIAEGLARRFDNGRRRSWC